MESTLKMLKSFTPSATNQYTVSDVTVSLVAVEKRYQPTKFLVKTTVRKRWNDMRISTYRPATKEDLASVDVNLARMVFPS